MFFMYTVLWLDFTNLNLVQKEASLYVIFYKDLLLNYHHK